MKKLTVDASTENLSRILEFIDAELEAAGADMKMIFQVDLAVEEIYTNIAHYAYAPDDGKVIIQFDAYGDPLLVEIQFIDCGKPFNPLNNPDPDITLTAEERQIGGLGVLMVKKTMDEVDYRFEENKNILTIKKYVS
ncbi:ATP-binding protein [Acetobacterium carbinolicum]|uniref:ATP-binding protein n=1 Tax=Acetobacterium carbinolicum TaxID=52690 RepID=UPI0039BF4EFA